MKKRLEVKVDDLGGKWTVQLSESERSKAPKWTVLGQSGQSERT